MLRVFICNELSQMIQESIDNIESYSDKLNEDTKAPFFIYSYAMFESVLTETLRYYLNAFPEKIDKAVVIDKDTLTKTVLTKEILFNRVNSYIRMYSTKSLNEYIEFLSKTLSIDLKVNKNRISRMVAIRNVITHDNILINRQLKYIAEQPKIELTLGEMKEDIQLLVGILKDLIYKIKDKYNDYTKEKLVKEFWYMIFSSPLLNFERIWTIKDDGVICINDISQVKKIISSISSSERYLLSLFINEYSNSLTKTLFADVEIPGLVSISNKREIVEIIEFFTLYPYMFNGEHLYR